MRKNPFVDKSLMAPLAPGQKLTPDGQYIPPGWKNVFVAKMPTNIHQAVGVDSVGRIVYLRSKNYKTKSELAKYERLQRFMRDAPKLSTKIKSASKRGSEEAKVLNLMLETGFRVGSNKDTKAKQQAYGTSTLLGSHVRVNGNEVTFDFIGKKGVRNQKTVVSQELADMITHAKRRADDSEIPLFRTDYRKISQYWQKRISKKYPIKDLRLYRGTRLAMDTIEKMPPPVTKKEWKRARNQVGDAVATELNNTRTVALGSYIAPEVFAKWGKPPLKNPVKLPKIIKGHKTLSGVLLGMTGIIAGAAIYANVKKNECLASLAGAPAYRISSGPLVSIVIPTIQEEEYLPKLFASISNQTYANVEVIVSDSSDEDKKQPTISLIDRWSDRLNITMVDTPRKNVSAGRNGGACAAQGEYLLFVDADCIMEPYFIEKLVKDLASHRLVHGLDVVYDNDFWNTVKAPYNWFKSTMHTTGRGVMIRATDFWSFGGYNENLDPYLSHKDREDLQLAVDVEAYFGQGSVFLDRNTVSAESFRRPFPDNVLTLWGHRGYRNGRAIDRYTLAGKKL